MLIVLEGIDGSGKGTVAKFIIEALEQDKGPVFNVINFCKEHKRFPRFEEFKNHTLLLTGEPTYAWIGSAIREEMVRTTGEPYSPRAIAEAFALDRLIHYKRVVLPALEAGCTVVQERGVASSLAYQSLTAPDLTMEVIAQLEGNAFQLRHPPNVLVIAQLPAKKALERLGNRADKKDYAIYEKQDFLEKLTLQYQSKELRAYFQNDRTRTCDFSTEDELGIMKQKVAETIIPLIHNYTA